VAAVLLTATSIPVAAQVRHTVPRRPVTPYEQGYAAAYNTGYGAGQDDYNRTVPRDLNANQVFQDRERNYDPRFADSEEYRQGYNLGLEFGYMDGYYGRTRSSIAPANGAVLAKAAVLASTQRARQVSESPRDDRDRTVGPPQDTRPDTRPESRDDTRHADARDDARRDDAGRDRPAGPPLDIPSGTQLNLRLTSQIDSKRNRVGDRFTSEVTTPGPYEGAVVAGHIQKLNQSGKVSGRTEMALAFDSITLRDGRSADLSASLDKIIESESVKEVDEEGNVRTGSRTKDSQTRGAIGGAAGAILGGIAGGVKGAVLGAIIGGAAGVGTVYIEGNKELILDPGTEMVIRTERTRAR
jgi:hypothetical protein